MSPNGATVFVTDSLSREVGVIATSTNTLIGLVTVGYFPNGVAVGPTGSTVYVTSECGSDPTCWSPGSLIDFNATTLVDRRSCHGRLRTGRGDGGPRRDRLCRQYLWNLGGVLGYGHRERRPRRELDAHGKPGGERLRPARPG